MMNPVEVLRAKRAKILADAQRAADALDADARELERLTLLAEKYGLALVEKTETANGEEVITVDPSGPAYRAAINISENALKAAGRPLELNMLFDACISAGVPLAGKRPQSTLSAYLSHQASTVESIRRGVYWLKGVNPPDPGHVLLFK